MSAAGEGRHFLLVAGMSPLGTKRSSLRRRAVVRLLGSCGRGQSASLTPGFDPKRKVRERNTLVSGVPRLLCFGLRLARKWSVAAAPCYYS